MSFLIPLEIIASALAGSSVVVSIYNLLKRIYAEKKLRHKLTDSAKEQKELMKLLMQIRNDISHNSKPDHEIINKYIKEIETMISEFNEDDKQRLLKALNQESERAKLSLINEQVTEATGSVK